MNKRLYLAYGSNLSIEQMAYRCKTAKVYGKGILKNYELLFKGSRNNAYLTIEEKINKFVPVVVWEIEPKDEEALDIYEGFPVFYFKQDVVVDVEGVGEIQAMVYIMNKSRRIGIPSSTYFEIVKQGYEYFSFDVEVINNALKYCRDFVNAEQ